MRKILFLAALAAALFLGGRYLFDPDPAIQNARPLGDNIICFGDSLTYGTGAPEGMDYPSQLASLIGLPVINKGVPGDTTAKALIRLGTDVLAISPRIVLLTLGGNDLKNGVKRDETFRNLHAIVTAIQSQGALVLVGGIEIPFIGRGFGEAYRRLCEETGAVLIPNVYEGIMGKPGMMSDQIHPNEKGYGVMARHFQRAMEPFLR